MAPTYGLSINVYGRGDAKLGDGPSHMGIAIYEHGSSTCTMHHVRNPTDEHFIYDPRTQPLDEDPVLRGRCVLATTQLSSSDQQQKAASLLSAFGNDQSNIPEFGIGNCQDWVAAAVGMLEQNSLVSPGEGRFWKSMINKSAEEMKNACLQSSRKWIDGPESTWEGEPDARFGDKSESNNNKPVGKLVQNEAFRARMQSLLGGTKSGDDHDETPVERPFYVSSPFFSKMHERDS